MTDADFENEIPWTWLGFAGLGLLIGMYLGATNNPPEPLWVSLPAATFVAIGVATIAVAVGIKLEEWGFDNV